MRQHNTQISWKGIGDYLSAARTISDHGTSNTSGPRMHCQGLAVELALKFFLWDKNGTYPGTHNLEALAFNECNSITFSEDEKVTIKSLNSQYLTDGLFDYPARYQPPIMRIFTSPSQENVETVISTIIQASSQPELLDRILTR